MDTHKIRVPDGEKARTTIDLATERLLSVDTGGGLFLCFLEPNEKHAKGSIFLESKVDKCRLRVVKLILSTRKTVELQFVRREAQQCESPQIPPGS